VLPAANRARRGHGGPLDYEISQWPQRRARRSGRLHTTGAGRATRLCAESRGCDPLALRMLAGVARSEDACRTHAATRPQWAQGRGVLGFTSESEKGFLPRVAGPSATRIGAQADVGLRLDDHF